MVPCKQARLTQHPCVELHHQIPPRLDTPSTLCHVYKGQRLLLISCQQDKVHVYRSNAEFQSSYSHVFSEHAKQEEVYQQVRCEWWFDTAGSLLLGTLRLCWKIAWLAAASRDVCHNGDCVARIVSGISHSKSSAMSIEWRVQA